MKLKFELSKLALEDINDIWTYSSEQWSNSQANKYYKLIFKEIDSICKNPEIGKSIQEVKIHHRIKLVKSHLIVYKVEEEKIYIDRILHQQMDIESHLDK